MPNRLHRRTFLKTAAVAAAGAWAAPLFPAWASPSTGPLATFAYGDVELLPSPLKAQFEYHHNLFLNLDDDRLLKVFRQQAGMPAPGEDMGGWYDLTGFDLQHNDFHGFVPGHSFGQYVSALARSYAATGDEPTRAKVQRLVKGYTATLDAKASFFAGYRLPAYTYDKISCGLIDAHQFAHDSIALKVHEQLTRAVMADLPEKALSRAEQRARPHKDESYTWDESYTLPENLFLAYQRSGRVFYRDLAARFLADDTYFDPLARGINVLAGEHAYSHVNAFSSAMQAYLTLGSEKHLRAARNGFAMLTEQSYATGGWGPDEGLIEPGKGRLGESLNKTHASFETPCGAYGHFKITRYLMQVSQDSRYGDSMERVLYNTILGAKPILPDGTSFYYSDYDASARKVYHRDKWPCCSGTLPQLAADYHVSIYLRSPDGVYVNLYVPSKLRWNTGGAKGGGAVCELTQQTKYPLENDGQVQIQVAASRPAEYTVYLRIPAWVEASPLVSVNGQRVSSPVGAGSFAAIRRTWKDGDRIELELPMPLCLEAVDEQHPNLVALSRGPLVLCAISDARPTFERSELLRAQESSDRNDKNGDRVALATDGTRIILRPFMSIGDENYNMYVLQKA
jgi:DUF1680 family protein